MAGSTKAKIATLGSEDARPAPVVLISGPEEFLANRASRTIRDALRNADPAVEIHDVDAAGYTAGELFTLASPALFAEPFRLDAFPPGAPVSRIGLAECTAEIRRFYKI